jgi:hypothetical protein
MVIVIMDLELGLIQIKLLMLGNGKMAPKREKASRLGRTDMCMRVNLMTANGMAKEL